MATGNFDAIIRRSLRREFGKKHYAKIPHPKNTHRVTSLTDKSEYARYGRFIIGKLVRILEQGLNGGYWVEFVCDNDRMALNAAAGWSENKRRYLLDGVKFDD